MSRFMALALCFVLPTAAHAASLKDFELSKMLEKVAKESSVGTPRAINEDILDQGYTVEGNQLINHLSVRASHAERMRSNPDSVRSQLGDSVCSNTGYRQLLARGAILTYSFTEYKTNQPVATERFDAGSCRIQGADPAVQQARLALCIGVKNIIHNVLTMFKINVPEKM